MRRCSPILCTRRTITRSSSPGPRRGHWAADAFLKGYTAAIEHAPLLPRDEAGRHLLLSAFILDKALYELEDELNDRPDRVRIPLIGIRKLIGA